MSERRILFHRLGIAALGLVLLLMSASFAGNYFESAKCARRMELINQAAIKWAAAHEGCLPPDLRSLSTALGSPRLLVCPGDHSREPAASWDTVFSVNSSYKLVGGLPLTLINTPLPSLACDIHNNFAYLDGTVVSRARIITSPRLFYGLVILTVVWLRFFVVLRNQSNQEAGLDAAALKLKVALRREQHAAGPHRAQDIWYRKRLLAAARKAVQALAYFRLSRS